MTYREAKAADQYTHELIKAVFSDEFLAKMGMSRDVRPFMGGMYPEKAEITLTARPCSPKPAAEIIEDILRCSDELREIENRRNQRLKRILDKWEAQGRPDFFSFKIDKEPFSIMKNSDGTFSFYTFNRRGEF